MFQNFQVFLAAALVLALLPGPSIFYVSTRSLAAGRLEGLASGAGTGIGGMVHVAAGAAGVSAIVLASAKLFALMKLAGAVYLVWMGIGMIRSARRDAAMLQAVDVLPANPRRAVVDGIFVEALNPKTAAFFLAFLPQFVDLSRGHVALQFAALGLVSVALNTSADLAVALAAGAVRGSLSGRGEMIARVRQGAGGLMLALGLDLLMTRRLVA
ncbi:MAG: LysE family translocator [Acidocella sp.]|uniref:LysE family translocator n=1 Tax=Acidocella sp. TaxID=50710 RepID=UPI003FD73E25